MRARRKSPGGHERVLAVSSSLTVLLLLGGGLVLLAGCEDDECVGCLPLPPPAPTGVQTITGDEGVTVCWDHVQVDPRAPEIASYMVWRDTSPGDDDEVFEFAGEVLVQGTPQLSYCFFDAGLDNGFDYSYAVSAVDRRGAESELSRELVIDTPRPEGYDLLLSAGMGFDFSSLVLSAPAAPSADIEILVDEGFLFAAVHRPGVLIQDYGTFVDSDGIVRLDWVDWAPQSGYSTSGKVELIEGHAYILEILEVGAPYAGEIHYAKFAVTDVGVGGVLIDWAYQIAPDLPELRMPAGPGVRGQTTAARDQEVIRF